MRASRDETGAGSARGRRGAPHAPHAPHAPRPHRALPLPRGRTQEPHTALRPAIARLVIQHAIMAALYTAPDVCVHCLHKSDTRSVTAQAHIFPCRLPSDVRRACGDSGSDTESARTVQVAADNGRRDTWWAVYCVMVMSHAAHCAFRAELN